MAMLVPALLAGGLMMADVAGYDLAAVHGVSVDAQAWREAGARRAPVVAAAPGGSGTRELRAESRSASRADSGTEEPRLVPPPLRPYRIYNGWVPPDVVSVSYSEPVPSSTEGDGSGKSGKAADGRKKRREPGRDGREESPRGPSPDTARPEPPAEAGGGEEPPEPSSPEPSPTPSPETPPEESAERQEGECSLEWRGTWLWELCADGNRQKI
ncbi:hypothetical protein [Planomonospora alba]|uniref:hypothetical protein n=1 Tax=Planomonospora alba TaxID=161354 RepID=UPI0031EEBD5E